MLATAHHIGCAVKQLDDSCSTYAGAFGLERRTRSFDIPSQQVRVRFVELGRGFYLELVAPLSDKTMLTSFFKVGFYHLCFLVDDLDEAQEHLRLQGFSALPVFKSEAFAGGRCQFFLSPQTHLVELVQMSTKDFGDFFSANLERQN